MNTEETININDLLSRPVWQLTCEEYCALMRHLLNESGSSATNNAASRQAIGMTALAKALGCSSSFLYGISHNIDMDSAVRIFGNGRTARFQAGTTFLTFFRNLFHFIWEFLFF